MTHAEFLAERKTGIGGSDVACLFGLSPFGSPANVYMQKMGMDEGTEDNERMFWGRRLEPTILEVYAEDKNVRVIKPVNMLRHPDKPHIIGHPDGLVFSNGTDVPDGLVEAKNVGVDQLHRWPKEDNDGGDVPDYINLQGQHYMLLTDLPWCDVVALVGGNKKIVRRVHRHQPIIDEIITTCDKFWFNHVVPKIPPPVDSSEGATKLLRKLYHDVKGGTILADGESAIWGERYLAIRSEVDELEDEQNLLKNKMMELMASASYFEGPFGRFSWNEVKGRDKIDWKALAVDMKIPEEIIKVHTKTGEPTRRFNPPRRKSSYKEVKK